MPRATLWPFMPPRTASTPDFLTRISHDWAQIRPDVDASSMELLVLLGRLQAALSREIGRTYLPSNLNAAGWDLLLTLYRSAPQGGLTPTQLSTLSAISGPSMTNRIDRLALLDYVERRQIGPDRRSVHVRLTAGGRELVERLLPQHLETTAQVLEQLSSAERQQFRALATKLLSGIEEGQNSG